MPRRRRPPPAAGAPPADLSRRRPAAPSGRLPRPVSRTPGLSCNRPGDPGRRGAMNAPLSQSGAEAPLVRARKAHQAGEPYFGLSGHPWQEWLVTMEDGTRRRTSAPASGGGSGPRAARKNAEEGPYRDLSQPTYRQSVEAALSEGRRAAH